MCGLPRTIAMFILDFMKFEVSECDLNRKLDFVMVMDD